MHLSHCKQGWGGPAERESQVFFTGSGMIAARISRNRKEVSMQAGLQWATCLYECAQGALPNTGSWDSVSLFLQHSEKLEKQLILQLGAKTEGVPRSLGDIRAFQNTPRLGKEHRQRNTAKWMKKKQQYNSKSVWEDQQQTGGRASLEIYIKGKHTWLQKMR